MGKLILVADWAPTALPANYPQCIAYIYVKTNLNTEHQIRDWILLLRLNSMLIRTVIIFIFISMFIGLSQTTGPIINMLLMMSMDYKAKVSISLTYLFLAGGSIASIWKNAAKKSPKTGKSYVKMDLILLSLPTMYSGALFGGIARNFFSEIMITFLFIFLFLFLIYDLCKTLKQKRQGGHDHEVKDNVFIELQQMNKPLTEGTIKQTAPVQMDQSKTFIEFSARPSSKNKLCRVITLCIGYYIFTVLTSLLRGGPKYHSIIGIDACGPIGWAILFVHLLVSIIVSVITANKIVAETQGLTEEQIKKYSVQVTQRNVWYFLIAGFTAGFLGALMAIGATLILVPTWLKVGVDKDYAGSSTATLILMSSCVTFTVAYFNHVFEGIPIWVMVFYLGLAFISSALVKDFLAFLTKKYKLESLVIILLLIVVICTLLALVPFQITRLLKDYRKIIELGHLC